MSSVDNRPYKLDLGAWPAKGFQLNTMPPSFIEGQISTAQHDNRSNPDINSEPHLASSVVGEEAFNAFFNGLPRSPIA